MKARNIITFILGAALTSIGATSCGVDRWAGYAEQTKTDRWIDDTMRVWYYWYQDIPNTNKLNYFTDPVTFFKSLLSSKDGKNGTPYSTIDTLQAVTRSIPFTDYSYGFQFTTNRVENNDTALYAHVLYVAQGSPAAEIGLQRGEWIMKMNGEPITQKNYAQLYGSTGMNLTIGYYDAQQDTILAYQTPRQIASARPVNDNPVFYKNIYQRGGNKIGYLVYNHFSAGPTDENNEYNNELRKAFQYFASSQVNQFILDLRYNNGGLLSCAELLCAMLAPSAVLGQPLGHLEYNDRVVPRQTFFNLNADLIQEGANLNLSTLYVLTSSETASASEMLINCLKPYMNVILIGATTEGKNVGSIGFTNDELQVVMHPIVCKIYNSQGTSDYEQGFNADIQANENNDLARFLPFGDENELLLHTALSVIEGSWTTENIPASTTLTPINSSITRRAMYSVTIK